MKFLLKTPLYFLLFFFFLINNLAVKAAETIRFNYGPLEFSISVQSLKVFAEEGIIEPELAFYLNRLNIEKQLQVRQLLQTSYQVNPIIVSRFAHTTAGQRLINELGELINLSDGSNGFYGVRGALVQSANHPEGINLINFISNFPTDIKLNTGKIIKVLKQWSNLSQETREFVTELEVINTNNVNISKNHNNHQLLELNRINKLKIKQEIREFKDETRGRKLVVDFYLPETINQSKIPVIFVANGIGARRNRFQSLAENLAQQGFAVVIPDNPGSNHQRQQDFFRGLYQENFDIEEFINLPLDISFLLDELEKINNQQWNNQLNLKNVGIFGYSFGGTTALSLAGAKINFEQLKKDCITEFNPLNISAFYQCRALEIPPEIINHSNLTDERIKAAFLFVPFGKVLFGEKGLSKVQIPIFWQATAQDLITPLMLEQIPSFNSLDNSNNYLAVSQGLPHALITLNSSEKGSSLEKIRGVMETYVNTLSLIFFKIYLNEEENYLPLLNHTFLEENLTEKPYNLNLVQQKEIR
jgi:predicted dienelactone hydrolase